MAYRRTVRVTRVFFKKTVYDYKVLMPVVRQMITDIGDLSIRSQTTVLIKPNLLLPTQPERAVLTHRNIVRAVVEYVLDMGGRPQISDSPAMGPFDRIVSMGGYAEALKGLNVKCKPFKQTAKLDIDMPFGTIDLARDAVEADVIINLAKLKTHSQMYLTLGVKNMFGCVVGLMKPEWHLRAGIDRDKFARLLVQVCHTLAPALTLVDGVLAMEGQGPGKSGIPRELGVVVGSRSAFAADRAICKFLGIEPEALATNRAAAQLGLVDESLYIAGDFHMVHNFKFPDLGPLTFGPGALQRLARKHLLQKPVVDDRLCGVCSKCWEYCPARAILRDQRKIRIDYDRCIRCYCCQEVCPEGAIKPIEPLAGKLVRKITKRR